MPNLNTHAAANQQSCWHVQICPHFCYLALSNVMAAVAHDASYNNGQDVANTPSSCLASYTPEAINNSWPLISDHGTWSSYLQRCRMSTSANSSAKILRASKKPAGRQVLPVKGIKDFAWASRAAHDGSLEVV